MLLMRPATASRQSGSGDPRLVFEHTASKRLRPEKTEFL
jgi:hypothetical protein